MKLKVEWTPAVTKGYWRTIPHKSKNLFQLSFNTISNLVPNLFNSSMSSIKNKDLFSFFPGFSLGSRRLPEIEPFRSDYNTPILFVHGVVSKPVEPIRDIFLPNSYFVCRAGMIAAMIYGVCGYNLTQEEEGPIVVMPKKLYTEIINEYLKKT